MLSDSQERVRELVASIAFQELNAAESGAIASLGDKIIKCRLIMNGNFSTDEFINDVADFFNDLHNGLAKLFPDQINEMDDDGKFKNLLIQGFDELKDRFDTIINNNSMEVAQ